MAEDKKRELQELFEELQDLNRDDLMKTYGFVLGRKASQTESHPG